MSNHNIWIGSAYQATKPKILILGESDYGDTPPLKEYIPQWLDKKHRDHSFARISNTFGNSAPRSEFWSQIAFYNYVPGMVGETRNDRPTRKAYELAQPVLAEVLNLLNPDGVLILGIEQSEYSEPVVQNHGVTYGVSPHPASRGLKNDRLTAAWSEFMHALGARS